MHLFLNPRTSPSKIPKCWELFIPSYFDSRNLQKTFNMCNVVHFLRSQTRHVNHGVNGALVTGRKRNHFIFLTEKKLNGSGVLFAHAHVQEHLQTSGNTPRKWRGGFFFWQDPPRSTPATLNRNCMSPSAFSRPRKNKTAHLSNLTTNSLIPLKKKWLYFCLCVSGGIPRAWTKPQSLLKTGRWLRLLNRTSRTERKEVNNPSRYIFFQQPTFQGVVSHLCQTIQLSCFVFWHVTSSSWPLYSKCIWSQLEKKIRYQATRN